MHGWFLVGGNVVVFVCLEGEGGGGVFCLTVEFSVFTCGTQVLKHRSKTPRIPDPTCNTKYLAHTQLVDAKSTTSYFL